MSAMSSQQTEKSDLEELWSRKRPISRRTPPFGVLFARRAFALLASPDAAGGGLGRVRVVSLPKVLLSFFGQSNCSNPIFLFGRTDAYQFGYASCNKQSGQDV